MGQFFTDLLKKIDDALAWIGGLFQAVFVALWDMVKDAFVWCFDQVLKLVVSVLSSIDTTGISGYVSQAGDLPAEILNVLAILGVGAAVGIITAAIIIRLLLQLIPFTRLGS